MHLSLGRYAVTLAAFAALITLGLSTSACQHDPAHRTPLKQLYTPSFRPPPPHEDALVSLRKLPSVYAAYSASQRCCERWQRLPGQVGVLLISFVVMLLAGFEAQTPFRGRNLDLLLSQAVGWCFFDIMGFSEHTSSTSFNIMDWLFTLIVLLTMALLVRAIRRVYRPGDTPWRPTLGRTALAVLAIAMVGLDIADALGTPPDDAGYFVNIGAQRLRERGRWPYGDPLLTSTPAAAYGPVLYLAHLPFQLLLSPRPVNPPLTRPPIESADVYFEPPLFATQLATIALHLLGIASLFFVGFRLSGPRAGWALVALYCSSAFVLGVGDGDDAIGGMTFVSHIGPTAISLLALALVDRPEWSGVALAAAGGALFYPLFFVPAWLGYYWSRPSDLKRFLIGFGVAAAVLGASVLLLSRPADGRGLVATIVHDTIGHQEGPTAYGKSIFGFWGQREGIRKALMTPLVGDESLTRPVVLAFFAFAAAMFFVAQRRTPAQLALVAAAVAMGAQLWKIHATATYVAWYYPLLLIGILCDRPDAPQSS